MGRTARLLALAFAAGGLACGNSNLLEPEVEWADETSESSPLLSRARIIHVPGSDVRVAVWDSGFGPSRKESAYAIARGAAGFAPAKRTEYVLLSRDGSEDPSIPDSALRRTSRTGSLYLVQFYTYPLQEYRNHLRTLGAQVFQYFPRHAHIVRMTPEVARVVTAQPYVRAVAPFRDSQRVDALVPPQNGPASDYLIQPVEQTASAKVELASQLAGLGATLVTTSMDTFLLRAKLTAAQREQAATLDGVLHIDSYAPPEEDMDIAREISGANFLESITGFNGAGVRGEVMDGNVLETHADFASRPIIFHGDHSDSASHGTCTTGIIFGDGTKDPKGRGLLPAGQAIFADHDVLMKDANTDRKKHTAELLEEPYKASFQSNSWGHGLTTEYTNITAEMDAMLFDLDFLLFNSQSNSGSVMSRPEAWAKNAVSIGGVRHLNTLDTNDDTWNKGGSIGPAKDGRIKPDLSHFWDLTWAPSSDGGYREFGGTSGATPITAGYAGLFLQMWSNGLFGNATPGTTVFDRRPHFTTTKAILINTATQWAFSGATHDLTRSHQGWGRVDIRRLYDQRNNLLIVNETDLLLPQGSKTYTVETVPGQDALRATLVYADPAAVPSAAVHRVNDLTLKVTAPDGTVYYGNNGLNEGNWSTPGGDPNTLDTVENIFVRAPAPGAWKIEVRADELVQDGHVETPEVDADYALVVSGGGASSGNEIPTASFAAPAKDALVSGVVTLRVNASDTDGSIARVVFTLPDGSTVTSTTAPYEAKWDTTQSADGKYTLTATAFDNKGASSLVAELPLTVKNGTTPGAAWSATATPKLALVDNGKACANVTVLTSGNASDLKLSLSGTHSYRAALRGTLTHNGVELEAFKKGTFASGSGAFSWNRQAVAGFTGDAKGQWTLCIYDTDALNDKGELTSFTVQGP